MTTTTSTALVPTGPVLSEPERLALAGFLAGYAGLTREGYALDLRQFAAWCHRHHLALFAVCRADIECFRRGLEAARRARATSHPPAVHDRRLLQVRLGRGAARPTSFASAACPGVQGRGPRRAGTGQPHRARCHRPRTLLVSGSPTCGSSGWQRILGPPMTWLSLDPRVSRTSKGA